MSEPRESTALRRAVLAALLLDRGPLLELEIAEAGVVRPGTTLAVAWGELLLAAGDPREVGPERVRARRVARWLRLRVALHDLLDDPRVADRPAAAAALTARVRPRGLPVDHGLHPGPAWPRRTVLGGALDLGMGLRGVDDDGGLDPEGVGLLPAGVLLAAGVEVSAAADRADRYLQDMAELAAGRLRLDPTAALRPLGDADVLTLLASATYRRAVLDGQSMRSAAVPSRTRGWLDLSRLDPAFAISAALLTDADERGFTRPILVTADEVTLARPGGDAVAQCLADPAPAERSMPVERIF